MPAYPISLRVHRDDTVHQGISASHILRGGPCTPQEFTCRYPNEDRDKYVPLRNVATRKILEAMNFEIHTVERMIVQYLKGFYGDILGYVTAQQEEPEGEINLPVSHSVITRKKMDEAFFENEKVVFEFSYGSFAINLAPNLSWRVGNAIPNGYLLTTLLTASATTTPLGTLLSKLIDITAYIESDLRIDHIEEHEEWPGLYLIHVLPCKE